MEVALVYSPALNAYDLGPAHPLRPERVSLAVALMEVYGLIAERALRPVEPRSATREELLRVHDAEYVETVERASVGRGMWVPKRGIGPGDTPDFPGMHEAAARVAGATTVALECVQSGAYIRAFSPAGGLHHAHRDRAAGFCVYNDVAVAIAAARAADPTLRVMYVDIDAHHGDGVQEAFYEDPDVLTVSLHESGRYLYPGTGSEHERGEGEGLGAAINVPLPPYATDECYRLAFDEVVAPAARAFQPDVIASQNGADAHWADPLTSLGLTLAGARDLYLRITALSDEVCGGRLVACGGGGYSWATVVPRAWTLLAATLVGAGLPERLPEPWREQVRALGYEPPQQLTEDPGPELDDVTRARICEDARRVVAAVAAGISA
ncbi:MAG: acetoin utilization protein AcuC [Coriobacteriia bacterium]|nr:acetoin utilization protein AcuC [Coriobacteriia bacterium]